MEIQRNISADIHIGRRVVTAALRTVHGDAIGEARCNPVDEFDSGTGEKLAFARALLALGKQMILEIERSVDEVRFT